jgi:hypothetical protein
MLHRQPSSKDRARKSWEAILGLRYFGPAKVVKEKVGGEEGPVFDTFCPGNERCALDHVPYALRGSKTASKAAVFGSHSKM